MEPDEVLREIREYREEYARRFNYDLEAIYRDLKAKEIASGREFVSRSPRRPFEPVPTDDLVVEPGQRPGEPVRS